MSGESGTWWDVFVRDRAGGTTGRASVADNEVQGNSDSSNGCISATGRFVAFQSDANNFLGILNNLDTNGTRDIFVRDIVNQTTTRVSVITGGAQAGVAAPAPGCQTPSISWDGRYVAFESSFMDLVVGDVNGAQRDIFVHDRNATTTTLVSTDGVTQSNLTSDYAQISHDGRFVAFRSACTNLLTRDSGWLDIYLHNRESSRAERITTSTGGGNANNDSYFGVVVPNVRRPGVSGP